MTSQVYRSTRAYTTPVTINMTGTTIEPARVWDLVLFTRLAAQVNGNKKDMWPVRLITTDGNEILDAIPDARKRYKPSFDGYYGMTFTRSSETFIWIKPTRDPLSADITELNTTRSVKKTIVHELAHARAHSGTSHGWTWRSLYARFLPLGSELLDFTLSNESLRTEIVNTIYRYQRSGETIRPERGYYVGPASRRYEEANKHVAATDRLLRRLVDQSGKLRYDLVATMVP